MLGQPADMEPIVDVAKRHKLAVVEDCAQANGAEYKHKKVGTFGDMGCFSFYLNKHITTGGEGGMIITNDEKLAKKARSIANHCRPEVSPYPNVPAHNVYTCIGYNYRMTAMQAAMGLAQLRKLGKFIEKRRRNAEYLTRYIKNMRGLRPPFVRDDVKHVYWAYGALVIEEELGTSRDKFAEALLAEGIKSEGYCPIPVHLQEVIKNKIGYGKTKCPFDCPLYGEKVTYRKGLCPKAEKLSSQDLLLPAYETLEEKDLKDVVTALEKVVNNADKLRD
jgi:dTDP-4-amino-4,6-dideoxygalactose transaminase